MRVCLAYPNHYSVAMGNLGFQVVYELCDREPEIMCERVFLPDGGERQVGKGLSSFESRSPAAAADILAFSVSFETDYGYAVQMLAQAGVPLRARERPAAAPLVIAGGPATFLNPEPLADFVDLFLIGEAEEMLPQFLRLYRECRAAGADRALLLRRAAAEVSGAYVPSFFRPRFEGAVQVGLEHDGCGPERVARRIVRDLSAFATTSRVLAAESVFGDMVLVEASRGCQWGCRFCAAGYIYRPLRMRGPAQLLASTREALAHRDTVGLIGAETASLPGVDMLAEQTRAAGGRLSPSSLKADCITPRLAAALAGAGNRSATVAPEAGSERMRRVINKNLTQAEIRRAAELLTRAGVADLKAYFMIGLPTETAADVAAIATLSHCLAQQVRGSGKPVGAGTLTVSVNPFVPKPWTPFQWEPMAQAGSLRAKISTLRRALAGIPRTKVHIESPRQAYLQTLLSRGDRRVGVFLEAVQRAQGDWWSVIRRWRHQGLADLPHPDAYVHRRYGVEEQLPWEIIDNHLAKRFLWIERRKALAARQTPPCDTATCTACTAC